MDAVKHMKLARLVAVLLASAVALPLHAQMEQPGQRQMREQEQEQPKEAPRLTKPPRITHQEQPVYPESARKEKRTGAVTLRITIDEEGYVSRLDVLQSAGEDLDWAAMGAVAGFVFDPAEVDGVPASIQLDYRQNFVFTEEAPPPPPPPQKSILDEPISSAEPEPAAPGEKPAGPVNFRGVVWEAGTKIALGDAEITVIGETDDDVITITADAKGRFEARDIPTGVRLIKVAHTGHEVFSTTEEFLPNVVVESRFYLPRRSYNKFETVVRDRKASKDVNRVTISRDEARSIPGTFGDPLRAIENLPSMARAPLLGGALLVRGTSPRSTGVYIDGVQVPLLYHFGGLTSVINPEYLETIEFQPGGFGAKYGRATAGIVDVKTRNMRMSNCRGAAKVDIMDSGFFFGCPMTLWGPEVDSDAPNARRITFSASARRSYIDAILPLALGLILPGGSGAVTVAPIYWDYQTKLEYRPFASHTFTLMGFGSDDQLKVVAGGAASGGGFGLNSHQQFHRLVAKWDWAIAPNVSNHFQTYTGVDWTFTSIGGAGAKLELGDQVRVFGVRNELRYSVIPDLLQLNLGLDYVTGLTEFNTVAGFAGLGDATQNFSVEFPRLVQRAGGGLFGGGGSADTIREERVNVNFAPYVDAEIGPILGLKLIPGFRFDYYKYGDGTRRFQPTPRLAARWEPIRGTVLKAAYGVYEQAPTPQETSPNLGNPRLTPERAIQYVGGFEQRLAPFLTVNVNGFYSDRSQLVETSSRVLSIVNGVANYERYNNQGIGRVVGADFMFRHELTKNFFGWVAYTISRSEIQSKPKSPWVLFDYDQTHILTVVGQYKIPFHLPFREWSVNGRLPRGIWWNSAWALMSGDWSVGARFRLVSGNPTTRYVFSSHDLDKDSFAGETGLEKGSRLPMFHQLDIRVDYKMAFNNWLVAVYLDLWNAYNQKNAEAVQWDYRYRTYDVISLLPLLPIVGFSAEF